MKQCARFYVYKKQDPSVCFWCDKLVQVLKYILGNPKETVWAVHDRKNGTFDYYNQEALASAAFK
jgi:hypothetical protein